jgi:hypothetical protein
LWLDWPHRHKVMRFLASSGAPSLRVTGTRPVTWIGPSGMTAISAGRSGSLLVAPPSTE